MTSEAKEAVAPPLTSPTQDQVMVPSIERNYVRMGYRPLGTGSAGHSESSSIYSGSGETGISDPDQRSSIDGEDFETEEMLQDMSHEINVDSEDDDEDLAASLDSLAIRDAVRDCLEKDPAERTETDIEILLDFTQQLRAFSNMTLAVRRALCSVMVFAVVERAGTVVMNDGEELDSWSVIVNGSVEIELPDGRKQDLELGDSFGITPTMNKMYHSGVMRTKVDDCQFVCITQECYYRILHQEQVEKGGKKKEGSDERKR
ncbi:unnamed protein product [Cyprideis torosa]|uniref:Uncharacterized protein n=1 Tax=Cyprideis torosa TaxID=163714 RepID=A0A7R8W2I5_9CRUS|nr:unnamed protein product [Cyprideis torosa]CAG0881920.1 unnamed protein product [Cyprideis torosa]